MTAAEDVGARARDADRTRQALLDAARRRFARDGYAATTVRDIAGDAGVNVSLIGRYFESKAGLFEACLTSAGRTMSSSTSAAHTLDDVTAAIVNAVAGADGGAGMTDALVIMLRSSGDEHAEEIRRRLLRSSSERLAALAAPGDDSLLRAQLVIALSLGCGILRVAGGPEPLQSAGPAELTGPVGDLIRALLG